ncbi:hypothetical protein HIM_00228 [Hirsutella minnesotensis 3608]|nr:hypothetical protein HIM_00228 [Hirsutella minnesotensis 3608]
MSADMPAPSAQGDEGAGAQGDQCLLTAAHFVKRESPQRSSSCQDDSTARYGFQGGGPAQAGSSLERGVESKQRSVSANARPGVSSETAAPTETAENTAKSRQTIWTPGFQRTMQQLKEPAHPANQPSLRQNPPVARIFARSASASVPGLKTDSVSARSDISEIKEAIEDVVEKQVAEALGPLRLIVTDLKNVIESVGRENSDLNEQNDILSRQIDLQYRDIQQHSEMASSHVRALTNLVEAHTRMDQSANDNLATTCNLIGYLSQLVVNLPQSLNQVVHDSVNQAAQDALGHVMVAQQESLINVQNFFNDQHDHLETHRNELLNQLVCLNCGYLGDGTPYFQRKAAQGQQAGQQAGEQQQQDGQQQQQQNDISLEQSVQPAQSNEQHDDEDDEVQDESKLSNSGFGKFKTLLRSGFKPARK